MKRRQSLRRRLPLNYAAIALLTALALGAVLLLTLRGYYRQLEQNYLLNVALTIGNEMTPGLVEGLPPAALQSQLEGYAFLTQTRIRLLGPDGVVLADTDAGDAPSDAPSVTVSVDVSLAEMPAVAGDGAHEGDDNTYRSVIVVNSEGGNVFASSSSEDTIITSVGQPGEGADVAVTGPFVTELLGGTSFTLNLGPPGVDGPPSREVVRQSLSLNDKLLGTLELSEGPAYGRAIVTSVAWGWALAGTAAVLLAALVGWWISRRLTAPLLALTVTTEQMSAGNLSARAAVTRSDEVGALSRSFNAMAARVEDMVGTLRLFVADAAHELHTPLTALRTDLELLRETATPAQVERLSRAQEQVRRLEKLTSNLLDLSRLESGTNGLANADVSLNELLRTASEPLASLAEQKGVAFTLALPSRVVQARGDRDMLQQAFTNLVDNAVKFTPGGGSVTVKLTAVNGQARVEVIDTGIGIPEEEQPLLFRRFHRGRNAAAYPGNGLGLAIAQAIAVAHSGAITADSGPDGTRMMLALPMASAAKRSRDTS